MSTFTYSETTHDQYCLLGNHSGTTRCLLHMSTFTAQNSLEDLNKKGKSGIGWDGVGSTGVRGPFVNFHVHK